MYGNVYICRQKDGAVLSIIKKFRIRTTYLILTSSRKATKQFYICLRMKLSNENVPADEAVFVLLGFGYLVCLFFFLTALKKKQKKEMDTCLSNTAGHPTIKWAMHWSLWFELSETFWINHSNSAMVLKLMQKLLARCEWKEWATTMWYGFWK